jgi:hypothetical protein
MVMAGSCQGPYCYDPTQDRVLEHAALELDKRALPGLCKSLRRQTFKIQTSMMPGALIKPWGTSSSENLVQ